MKFHPIQKNIWIFDTGLYRPGHTACYLLRHQNELAFIDTGPANAVPLLLQALDMLGFEPHQVRYILPTHVHLDHAGGAGLLLAHCVNATLATHHKGLPHLIHPEKLQAGATAVYGEQEFKRLFGDLIPADASRCQALQDGEHLRIGNQWLEFIETPGHANHHGCFFHPESRHLFTGDAFGIHYPELGNAHHPWLIATTTPVAFDPQAWMHSLEKMMACSPKVACLTHFGPIENPTDYLPSLQHSLQTHVRVALEEEAQPSTPQRQERLFEALSKQVLADLQRQLPQVDLAHAQSTLATDLHLNAQGLDVWLTRRARHNPSA